jgi:hypothetical protein
VTNELNSQLYRIFHILVMLNIHPHVFFATCSSQLSKYCGLPSKIYKLIRSKKLANFCFHSETICEFLSVAANFFNLQLLSYLSISSENFSYT